MAGILIARRRIGGQWRRVFGPWTAWIGPALAEPGRIAADHDGRRGARDG